MISSTVLHIAGNGRSKMLRSQLEPCSEHLQSCSSQRGQHSIADADSNRSQNAGSGGADMNLTAGAMREAGAGEGSN